VPLLFMGEEFGASAPFQFFCDFHGDLARAVREGRRNEFAGFAAFQSEEARARIPDPGAATTFEFSKLPGQTEARHRDWLALYIRLLKLRRQHIVPLVGKMRGHSGHASVHGPGAVSAIWSVDGQPRLELRLNLSVDAVRSAHPPTGRALHVEPPEATAQYAAGEMPARSAAVYLHGLER
jgi:1,4-alpha-glucan branching enzyme